MSSPQYSLDFSQRRPAEVQARIADGMQAADDHADPFWKRVIDGCILAVARKQAELSVDNVLDEIEEANKGRIAAGLQPVETHHLCAIGPAMKRAYRDKVISATGRVTRSTKAHKNGNLHAVWKSNFYGGK